MDAPEIPIHSPNGKGMGIIFPKILEDCGEMDFREDDKDAQVH